jgi:hypothetical protein
LKYVNHVLVGFDGFSVLSLDRLGGVPMDAKDIERYLSLLGEELQAIGVQEPIQLLLVGGGYMLTQVGK